MTPSEPRIYHITHARNLPSIVAEGELVCDAEIVHRGGPVAVIGMSAIKERRLQLPVSCHPSTSVGDYVPFYFCPRSVMLYVIYAANHPELTYKGGQGPILHLEADLRTVTQWADAQGLPWAFSLSNAGAYYTEFRSDLEALDEIEWSAIEANDFRAADVKEAKQAEFLVHQRFPLSLVTRIGVHSASVAVEAEKALTAVQTPPVVERRPDWYF